VTTDPLARDSPLAVAAMPQHGVSRFTRLIGRHKRATERAGSCAQLKGDSRMPGISDAKVLIVATDGFEERELFGPREILQKRGAEVKLASPKLDPIQATVHDDPGKTIRPDLTLDQTRAGDFDALVLPGGVRNPDTLRLNDEAIALIRAFADAGKPIAAICHGPWLLIETDLVRDKRVTGWPSIWTDLKNAGGTVLDEPAVSDGNIVTSRKPDDVEQFTDALIDLVERMPAKATRQPAEAQA
jgi:protease I